jgi:uncharacterized membrane protein YraQ (UPF0718 family)
MIQEQQHQSIVPLLKSYNACLISTIITIQAALSFAIPIYTSTSNLLSWTLASGVLVLHLLGTYSFHLSLRSLGLQRPRMLALYLIVPFANIPCVVELSRAVNAKMKEIGASRGMSFESVRAIEADIQENYRY